MLEYSHDYVHFYIGKLQEPTYVGAKVSAIFAHNKTSSEYRDVRLQMNLGMKWWLCLLI